MSQLKKKIIIDTISLFFLTELVQFSFLLFLSMLNKREMIKDVRSSVKKNRSKYV